MDILTISLLIRLTFCTIGFILNGTLVYVTWKNRSLRNSCNLLIAFDSLTACMYLFGKLPELLFIFKNDLRIPVSECFFYHIFAHLAHFFNKTAMLYIGFDRVLAVYCPIWYGKKNSRIYLLELLAVSVAVYSLLFTLIFMKCFFSDNSIVECDGITALYYKWENLFYIFVWVILFITNVFYALIWIKIKLLKRSEMSSFVYTERLLKSLLVLAIVYNFGNIIPLAFGMAKPLLMNKNMAFYSYQMALFTTIFMFSANPLLLYIFSLDYKDAYRRTFFANNSITVLNNNNANSKSFVPFRSINNNKQII